jgi:hypothetical protein
MQHRVGEVLYTGVETRVVAAIHGETGARVVLKLPCDEAPSPGTLAKLEHEYALLRGLAIPGVVRGIEMRFMMLGAAGERRRECAVSAIGKHAARRLKISRHEP